MVEMGIKRARYAGKGAGYDVKWARDGG